ncbi:MAG: phospho-N-acetylmuramoyl-pentapeptide-transferase [Ruminococcaceae bacterium]|nr:phospho-N-acetylmuramoyl-pentapeptide-transferase [Oscillospiraceae bacterium]
MNEICIYALIFLLSLVLTIVFTKKLIPIIKAKKFGQRILEDGPNWHKSKEGTPTMGGLGFIFAILICFFIYLITLLINEKFRDAICVANIITYALLNGMIGVIDDMAKIRNKRNEGLTPRAKFILQGVVAILFLVSFKFTVGIETSVKLPFVSNAIDLGFIFYLLAFFILCGFVNAVNLSDGIDGLASSLTLTVGIFFFIMSSLNKTPSLAFLSVVLVGAMIGFLIFNSHPAKIFMGDTGSLFLGALVVSFSFIVNNVLLVLLYGFVFLCEALSVILQVLVFKITGGKRLFKMAPLHHHFEKSGWSEKRIVFVFAIINLIACAIAYFVYYEVINK